MMAFFPSLSLHVDDLERAEDRYDAVKKELDQTLAELGDM